MKINRSNIVDEMLQEGSALKVANKFGVTRQYVSLVIKQAGLSGKFFKKEKTLTENQIERAVKREANKQAILDGCEILPTRAFSQQKQNARRRGVEWSLTFSEWWALWKDSYKQRGRHKNEFVMCRTGDTGPYSIGNVRIDSASINAYERIDRYWGNVRSDKTAVQGNDLR